MPLRTLLFIIFLSVFTGWLGWRYFTASRDEQFVFTGVNQAVTPTPSSTPKPVSKEDIAQLLAVPLSITKKGEVDPDTQMMDFIGEFKPGWVVLFGDEIATRSASGIVNAIRSASDPAPMIVVDHEGGTVQRLDGVGFTKLPSLKEICSKPSQERVSLFEQSATELQKVGVSVIFAPVVDLTASGSALKDRTCSADPTTTTATAQEMIVAFRQKGIYPVIKHYPGIGSLKRDLHQSLDAVTSTPKELPVFASLFKIFPTIGVMTTHVLVKDLSEEAPCSLNPRCVSRLKKDSPQALIFTDALEMESARTGFDLLSKKTLLQVSREALFAGNHVLVYGKDVSMQDMNEVLQDLYEEYSSNELMHIKIDEALAQIGKTKQEVIGK